MGLLISIAALCSPPSKEASYKFAFQRRRMAWWADAVLHVAFEPSTSRWLHSVIDWLQGNLILKIRVLICQIIHIDKQLLGPIKAIDLWGLFSYSNYRQTNEDSFFPGILKYSQFQNSLPKFVDKFFFMTPERRSSCRENSLQGLKAVVNCEARVSEQSEKCQ